MKKHEMAAFTGWLLDIYPEEAGGADPQSGLVVWFLGEDGRRLRLRQSFPITFYASGPPFRLRDLWRFLQTQRIPLQLSRVERRDLFLERPLALLAVQAAHPADGPRLFQRAQAAFPDLAYYDADIPLSLRYAAACGAFPLSRCQVTVEGEDRLETVQALESPWNLDPPRPPLRVLSLEPDCDPAHAPPRSIRIACERCSYRLSLQPARALLVNLRAILKRHDPDLLLTAWGDTWLLPRLLELAGELGLPLPLNRDPGCEPAYHKELSYFSYGQMVHRGRQVHLFGRWHVDRRNAMLWNDYELEGVLELARVTALPLQTAARVSPGTGISAMQMLTALRLGILVPWRKQQVEFSKSAGELFAADQGGLVYQPRVGLHRDVAEIDFVSMYPGIMVRFNISPETVGAQRPKAGGLDALELPEGAASAAGTAPEGQGLIPQTLAPLLNKRLALKGRLAELPAWHPLRKRYAAQASAHKWLLVTCFGYLGYKNARFGRIEAHEAVTAYGREALLRAKECAEDQGFTVLHMYVDGLWVQKPGAAAVADFQPLLEAISARTHLPIALDGIYRWVAFLPSRVDGRVPVPNRYFGVFQDGTVKMRGIEARRRDTPAFIVETQRQLLELLAGAPDAVRLAELLPRAAALLRGRLGELRSGRAPLEALLVGQKLSREIEEYRSPSPAARAAAQLRAAGKTVRPGQRVRFLYTRGEPGVYAWDLPEAPNPASVDVARYAELLRRAADTVLEPFTGPETRLALPLFANLPRRLSRAGRLAPWGAGCQEAGAD